MLSCVEHEKCYITSGPGCVDMSIAVDQGHRALTERYKKSHAERYQVKPQRTGSLKKLNQAKMVLTELKWSYEGLYSDEKKRLCNIY